MSIVTQVAKMLQGLLEESMDTHWRGQPAVCDENASFRARPFCLPWC